MRVVSRRLGHSDVQTTMNTYAHVTEDAELRAVADVTPELGEPDVDDEHVQCGHERRGREDRHQLVPVNAVSAAN